MRGIVLIDDGLVTHVIPRCEVRHVEVVKISDLQDKLARNMLDEPQHGWALRYQLAGTSNVCSVDWRGDCRPPSLRDDKKISIGEYNQMAAQAVQTTITRGHRDVHLERRSDGVILVRSGLLEDDARVVLCRKFITEMALTARQTAIGPLDEIRRTMLHEIHAAARDLVLPDWFPLKDEAP